MIRRVPVALALSLLAACESDGSPTGPEVPAPRNVLLDGSTTGNPHFFFLPPVADAPPPNGAFDGSLLPRVEICELSGTSCVAGPPAFTFTTSSGTGGGVVRVSVQDEHYMVNWDTRAEGVDAGDVFRASVFIVNLNLGYVDFEIGATSRDVRNINAGLNIGLLDGRTFPLKFRIEEEAVAEAETSAEATCFDEFANVIDCDVEIITSTEGGSATVFEDPGGEGETLAAIITIDPNDAFDGDENPVSDFQVTLQHVAEGPSPDLIPDQQIPFFIEVAAEDGEGDPVFFQAGALVVLCQPPDLGDEEGSPPVFLPDDYHHSLKIFRVHEGVTEILETTVDDGNCPGELHGGLNTILTGRFSGFGATLPTDPSLSTAVVPEEGSVGEPTVIDIQAAVAADEGSLPQIFGGDEVVVTVTGANSASATVTDNGDGTYTAEYTPTAAGLDMVDIRIRNLETGNLEPIADDVTVNVTGVTGLLLHYPFDGDATNTGQLAGYDGVATSVTFPAGKFGQAIKFDGTAATGAVFPSTQSVFGFGGNEWTISLWFREDAKVPQTLLWRFRGTNRGWETYHGVLEPPTPQGETQRMVTCSAGGCLSFFSDEDVWHSLVYRYDGVSATVGAPVDIYVDGVLEGQLENAGAIPLVGVGVTDIRMGNFTGILGPSAFFIDDFRVYNQVFSPADQCTVVTGGTWDGESCALP